MDQSELAEQVADRIVKSVGGEVKAFKKEVLEELDGQRDRIEALESRQKSPGKTDQERGRSRELKAVKHFLQTGDASGLQAPETKEMSIVGGAAAGGAMVPEVIAAALFDRAIARSRLASLVTLTPSTTSDYVRLLNLRGAAGAWTSETGTRSETATPTLREIRPTHGELYAYPAVTRWLVNDSQFDVDVFLRDNVEAAFSKSLENVVLFGNGTSKPTGMLNSSPTTTADNASPLRAQDVLQFINRSTDLANDLIDLYFKLKPEYRANAMFVMSSVSLAIVRKLRDSNGSGFLWQQNLSAAIDAPDGLLVGRPVVTTEELLPAGTSPANFSILCGDFRAAYELVRIGGLSIVRDEVTVPGKIKLYISQRFGGRLVDNDAVKVLAA